MLPTQSAWTCGSPVGAGSRAISALPVLSDTHAWCARASQSGVNGRAEPMHSCFKAHRRVRATHPHTNKARACVAGMLRSRVGWREGGGGEWGREDTPGHSPHGQPLVDGTVTIDESLTVLIQILAEPSTRVS